MPNFLPEVADPQFPPVYQLEENDPVQGGDDGIDNLPHKQLAERTLFVNRRAEAIEGVIALLKAQIDSINLSSGTALRSAVLLNWLYGDASPTFELWAPGFSWRDLTPIKVTQATAGDDTLDLATTEGLLPNRTYVLLDAAGNTLEVLDVNVILTATRLRARLNLAHTIAAADGAYLARTSAAVGDGYATFSPGDVYYSRVITELATQPGGQLVLRRSATGTGVFTVSYRVFGSTPWAQAPLATTIARGNDTRDETYLFAVGGQIEIRITYAGTASERVEHMVILPPAAVDKTPLVARPLNVSPADQAFNVGQTPTLTGSAFLSLYGLTQAGAEFRVARNPTMSDPVVSSSADFLASWVTVSGQSTPFADLVSTGAKAYTLVANGVSLRTTDGGLTFTPGTVTGDLRRVHANAGLLVAVGAAGAIRTSADNGLTYTTRATANGYAGTFGGVFVRGSFVVAVGDAGTIQRSINGGAIFSAISPDASYTGTFNSLAGDGTGKLIAVGTNGEIQTSADDGQTWAHRNAPNGYTGAYQRVRMDATGYAVAVGANGAIHTSADAGATWTARAAAGAFTGTFYGVSHRGQLLVAVGSGGEIQTSKDGGATWTHRAAGGGATGTFRAVSLDVDAYGLAIGDGGLVQRTLKLDAATSTFTVPAGVDFLAVNTVYWWQLRYFDAAGNASPWSAPTAFATSTAFNYVAAPQNLAPAAGDQGVSLLPKLQSSAFRAVGAADTHARSQWQISTSATFASVFYDSGETTDLLSHQVAAGGILATQGQYFWRCRHKGTTLGYGAWSEPTAFTAQARPDRPSILTPADGTIGASLGPVVTTSAFSMAGGGTQTALQVQIALVSSFASAVHDSGDVAGPTSYQLPAGTLSFNTAYFARARHKEAGGSYSAWSNVVAFKTMATTNVSDVFGPVLFSGGTANRTVTLGVDLTQGGLLLTAGDLNGFGGQVLAYDTLRGIGAIGTPTKAKQIHGGEPKTTEFSTSTSVGSLTPTGFIAGTSYAPGGYIAYPFAVRPGFFAEVRVNHQAGTADTIDLASLGTVGMIWAIGLNVGEQFGWHRGEPTQRFSIFEAGQQSGTNAYLSVNGTTATLSADAPSGALMLYCWAHDERPTGAIKCVKFSVLRYQPTPIETGWSNGIQFLYMIGIGNSNTIPATIVDTVRSPGFSGSDLVLDQNGYNKSRNVLSMSGSKIIIDPFNDLSHSCIAMMIRAPD